MAPQRLVARIRLDEISAELHLLVEELRDDIIMVIVIRRTRCALSIRVLGGVELRLSNLAQLSGQGLEQVLTVVEATVIGHVHGHPQSGGGQLIVQNLE